MTGPAGARSRAAPRAVQAKLLCDQVVGAPIAVSAFYVGEGPGGDLGGGTWY